MNATISRDELRARLDRGEAFQLVETLPKDDFRKEHLPHAVNLPPDKVREMAETMLPDKEADIVVYCANRRCTASEEAARELEKLGYSNVQRYVEGKQDWISAGLPTEGRQQAAAMT